MKTKHGYLALTIVLTTTVTPLVAKAETLLAHMSGFEEVPSSLFTEAAGVFRMKIDGGAGQIKYRLSYSGFNSMVRFAHIHFSQRHTNGGIMFWLCDNTGNGPIGTPPCPLGGGTVEGTLAAGDMVLSGQGLMPGDFDQAVEGIRAGATYVNVHSDDFPGGELRGQIGPRRGGRGGSGS